MKDKDPVYVPAQRSDGSSDDYYKQEILNRTIHIHRDDRPWRLATGSLQQFSAAKHKEFAGNVDSTPPPRAMVMHC